MKLEVGMYVRTNKVGIKKIYKIDNNKTKYKYLYKLKNQDGDGCIDLGVLCEDDIVKFSYFIIDILEVGDYVNGNIILYKDTGIAHNQNLIVCIGRDEERHIYDETCIKSIVTKEQFEQMAYKAGE